MSRYAAFLRGVSPMTAKMPGEDRLPGKDRARLLRPVTHGDHKVPGLPLQPVDAAGGVAGPWDAILTQRLDCVRIHALPRMRASALGVESSPGLRVEHRLRHLA